MDNTKVLDQMVLVVQAITLWSGKVKIDRARDFAGIADQLPPKALVTDGEINLVDPKHMNVLAAKRTAVQRVLEKAGIRFIGGALVRKDQAEEAFEEIERIHAEFDQVLDSLITNLPAYYAEQEAAFPGHVSLMRKHQLAPAVVRSRHRWQVTAFAMGEPGTAKADAAFAGAEASVTHAMLEAIARDAKLLQKSFHGRPAIGQRGLNCVKDIVRKLDSFAFVDARVYPCVQAFDAILAPMPKRNELSTAQTQEVLGVLARLADPEELIAQGSAPRVCEDVETYVVAETHHEDVELVTVEQVVMPLPLPSRPDAAWSGMVVI